MSGIFCSSRCGTRTPLCTRRTVGCGPRTSGCTARAAPRTLRSSDNGRRLRSCEPGLGGRRRPRGIRACRRRRGAKPNAAANPPAEATHPRWGHPGAHRPLCEHPTVVKDMRTATCPHCAADLSGVAQSAGETYDHVEIPLAPAVTTRIILRRGTCPCCRTAFKAMPPAGMEPRSPFGENLRATVVHLRQCHAVSYKRLASVLDVQFGVKLSEGALAAMLKAAAAAFAAQVAPIRSRLLAGTVIGSDETRFRVGKANWWLWVFQNADSCCFVVEPGRDKDVVERFLDGVRPRVWISDRLGSQAGWGEKHQACLAHLLRDAQYA